MRNWHSEEDTSLRSRIQTERSTSYDGRKRLNNVCEIDVDRIVADEQTRETFDEGSLKQLAENMKQHGQLQPVRVRWDATRSLYVIIAGERRWRAAKIAGLKSIMALVVENIDEKTVLREQVIENALREDLKPIEQAKAFQKLMDSEGWTGTELARQIQVNQSTVSRALKLLQLPEELQQKVDSGTLTAKAALASMPKERVRPMRKKPTREEKLRTRSATVTIKARKLLTNDVLIAALTDALVQVKTRAGEASRAA